MLVQENNSKQNDVGLLYQDYKPVMDAQPTCTFLDTLGFTTYHLQSSNCTKYLYGSVPEYEHHLVITFQVDTTHESFLLEFASSFSKINDELKKCQPMDPVNKRGTLSGFWLTEATVLYVKLWERLGMEQVETFGCLQKMKRRTRMN